MKNSLVALLLIASVSGNTQYYYKDLAGTAETNNLFKIFTTNKVQSVSLKSFDADGSFSEGFLVEQVIDNAKKTVKTTTRSGVTDQSVLTAWYDENARIIKTTDASGSSENNAVYTYDNNGRLTSIKSFSRDTVKAGTEAEDHQWFYTANGKPEKMLRIINAVDTTTFKFTVDDTGNVSQETPSKRGKAGDPVYYYYNDKNQVTDIVRFNYKLKKLLPDYMFEYSETGQIIQKITVPSNKASAYLIWRYQYDSKGLKVKEACFTKDKQLTGKIEYTYQFF